MKNRFVSVAPLTVCRINADRQLNKSMLFYRLGDTKNKQRNQKIPAIPMTILSAHLGLFCNGWDKDTWRHSRQWSPPIHYQSSSLHIDGHRIMFLSPGNINGSTCQGHKPRLACSPPTIRDNDFAAHRCHLEVSRLQQRKIRKPVGLQMTPRYVLLILRWQILQNVWDRCRYLVCKECLSACIILPFST